MLHALEWPICNKDTCTKKEEKKEEEMLVGGLD